MKNGKNAIALHDRVRLIRIQTFFNNATGNPYSLMGTGVLFSLLLNNAGVPGVHLLAWLALLVLACVMVLLFERHVKRVGVTAENGDRLFRARVVLGGVLCSLYGGSVFFLSGLAAGAAHIYVFAVTSSVVAVGYMAYATAFRYGLMVDALTLLPFTGFCFYRYFIGGDSFFLLLGSASVVWQIIVIGKALQVSRSAVGEITAGERLKDEVTEHGLAEQALRASEDQSRRLASMLRLMCDNVPDMIWAKDLENRYIFANKTLCERLLNCASTEEPVGKTFDYFVQRERDRHPDDPEWNTFGQFSQDVDRHTISREEPTIFEESGNVRGSFIFLDMHQARFIDDQGELLGTVGCARDITERKASEAFVQHLAHHDVLTDLPNRSLLTDRLRQALAQVRRDRGKLAVLFLDLDRLKPVNDTLGHDIGDQLLKATANRLREIVTRESDTVARLGGDEFVILLQRVNKESDAAAVAEKILRALSQPFSINRHAVSISASIGVAIYPQHGDEADTLLKNADAAMYRAKHGGRNGYCFFTDPAAFSADGSALP